MASLFRRKNGKNSNENGNRTSAKGDGPSSDGEKSLSTLFMRRSRGGKDPKKTSKTQSTTFKVKIPPNVRPGETFQVYARNRVVKVKCPQNAAPGQSLAITLPREEVSSSRSSNTGTTSTENELHSPNVNPIPDTKPPAYMVTIPPHVRGGQRFPVKINGVHLMVTCPHNALPGISVRIVPPKIKSNTSRNLKSKKGQLFEVQVPIGVKPGKPFALLANGLRISVKCPAEALPGEIIRFHLPFRATSSNFIVKTLNYDVDGWIRTLQISEMKFQWVRVQKNSDDIFGGKGERSSVQKQILQLAYVTQHSETDGLDFLPAQHGMVESSVLSPVTGEVLAECTDLIAIQTQNFSDKMNSFYDLCKQIGNHGRKARKICIQVRRDFLLEDSLEAVMSLNPMELKHVWRFQFIGEEGVDAGGLKREWFQLISELLLDPDSGLWMCCGGNQMHLQINPSSGISCEDDLLMFRFLGRVLGKALFDRQLIAGHMVQYLYKHLLGWPITFADLEHLDPVFYKSLKSLIDMDDVEYACLDFSTVEKSMGVINTVELIPNGENTDVTNENLVQYLEALVEYRLMKRVKNQMKELLLGFIEVIPKSLLTIFDFQELELMMCGLPNIDVDDWMENTRYSGLYNKGKGMHQVCEWFWELVREMSEEHRAKLLQFVTGTSGVPAKGFSILQANDGEIRLFQVHGVAVETCLYPRAHTCFNRIDLPTYDTKAILEEKLIFAVTMVATGFSME